MTDQQKYGVMAASLREGIYVGRLNKARTAFLDKELGTDMVLAAVAQYVERHFDGDLQCDFPGMGLLLDVKVTSLYMDTSSSSPEPGEAYYVMYGWSGCAGSAWHTLTDATKDGWRHAEQAQARANALSSKVDRCTAHLRAALGYDDGAPDAGLESLAVQVKASLA